METAVIPAPIEFGLAFCDLVPVEKRDKPLFHYTSAVNLAGIAGNGELWASDVTQLNDPHEIQYGIEIIRGAAEKKGHLPDSLLGQAIGHTHLAGFNATVFCASLSDENDKLSQWRAYADGGSGYALGFHSPPQVTVAEQSSSESLDVHLVRVNYDNLDQRRIADVFVDHAVAALEKVPAGQFPRIVPSLRRTLLALLASWKNAYFGEEKEWRLLVILRAGDGGRAVLRRLGPHGLVPYVRLQFDKANAFSEIKCGPKTRNENERNLRAFLGFAGIGATVVTRSVGSLR